MALPGWGFWKAVLLIAGAYFLLFTLPNLFTYWAFHTTGVTYTPLSAHRAVIPESARAIRERIEAYGKAHKYEVNISDHDGDVGGFIFTPSCMYNFYQFEPHGFQIEISGRDPHPERCSRKLYLAEMQAMLGAKLCASTKSQHLGAEPLFDHRSCADTT